VDLVERREELVAEYSAGSLNTEALFQRLLTFTKTLTDEQARTLPEALDEKPRRSSTWPRPWHRSCQEPSRCRPRGSPTSPQPRSSATRS
jgi:hypothetical protein